MLHLIKKIYLLFIVYYDVKPSLIFKIVLPIYDLTSRTKDYSYTFLTCIGPCIILVTEE